MKTALLLIGVISVLAFAEETTVENDGSDVLGNIFANAGRVGKAMTDNTGSMFISNIRDTQKAIAGDLDLKMMMMEDGSSKGKCYCSCNLNNQPVFMELDSANLHGTYAVV